MKRHIVSGPAAIDLIFIAGLILGGILVECLGSCSAQAQSVCPPSGCPPGVGVGVNVGRLSARLQAGLSPVVRNSCVVPVFFGSDPSPAAGVYVGTIRGRGVVLTCLHAAKHGVRAVANVVPIDIHKDKYGYDMVAVLVPPLDVPAATVGDAPGPGVAIEIIGYPLGRFGRHRGRVVGYFRAEAGRPWGDLSLDASSQNGDSGGAVLDSGGVLVGLLWGTRADGTTGSVAISAPAIADFLRRLAITLGGESGPPIPQPPPGPTEPPPVEPSANCDDLRILIQQNAEAIAALTIAAKAPGPKGDPGPRGEFDPAALTEEQLAALRVRLGKVRIQTVKPDGTLIAESSAPLGAPIKLRLTPISKSGAK